MEKYTKNQIMINKARIQEIINKRSNNSITEQNKRNGRNKRNIMLRIVKEQQRLRERGIRNQKKLQELKKKEERGENITEQNEIIRSKLMTRINKEQKRHERQKLRERQRRDRQRRNNERNHISQPRIVPNTRPNASGGGTVHIKGIGKRKIHKYKNGNKYVIVKGIKKSLEKIKKMNL